MTVTEVKVVTEQTIRVLLRTSLCREPLTGIRETGDSWGLGNIRVDKRWPSFSDGFGRDLDPASHFYKRWFDFPDVGKRGWAVIFQVCPPESMQRPVAEYFCGWVPADRVDEADGWITFLNAEIKDRLHQAAEAKARETHAIAFVRDVLLPSFPPESNERQLLSAVDRVLASERDPVHRHPVRYLALLFAEDIASLPLEEAREASRTQREPAEALELLTSDQYLNPDGSRNPVTTMTELLNEIVVWRDGARRARERVADAEEKSRVIREQFARKPK